MRKAFVELSPESYKDALIIVDVDGTLVPDSGAHLPERAERHLRELNISGNVYLCSNALPSRTAAFASLAGVKHLESRHKKPSRRVIENLESLPDRIIVIGDKALTDGLFAANIGAEFVKVKRLRGEGESFKGRVGYAVDALISPLVVYIRPILPFLMLMRPSQWVKNLLVFTPLFFAGAAFSLPLIGYSLIAFLAFSLAASAMYVVNDYQDREADAVHPTKRFRPLASGRVRAVSALVLTAILVTTSFMLCALVPALFIPLCAYLILNTTYSFVLKEIPFADVISVSTSYVLRVIAGGVATGIFVSPWLMSCVFFGALILITGKRRAELSRASRRAVLKRYSLNVLNYMLIGAAVLAMVSYTLYAVFAGHGPIVFLSTVLVVLAIARLVSRVLTSQDAEYPEVLALKDPVILSLSLAWFALMTSVLYLS